MRESLDTRSLGHGGPDLTLIGLGAWAIGGPGWMHGWGPQDDEVSVRTIHRSLDVGCGWIDTAAIYGLGHSEEVVGRAIGDRRDTAFIATKCINRWHADRTLYQSGRPQSIRQECEESLRRLGIEHIDLYQIHGPTADAPVEETWGELCRLQDEGKVRWIGVSNFGVDLLQRCMAIRPVQSLQPAYSLINRGIEEEVLPYCVENGIGVVPYGVMSEGMLSGRFDLGRLAPDDFRRSEQFRPMVDAAMAAAERLRPMAEGRGWTVGQLCVAWAMEHPAITSVIVGARSPEQVDQNVAVVAADRSGVRAEVDAALDAPPASAGEGASNRR